MTDHDGVEQVITMAWRAQTSEEHDDTATRARATEKAAKWEAVLSNILTGALEYGSRTPVKGIPAWVTTEVLTGGFATGELLAGGALPEHETRRLSRLPRVPEGEERRALNLRCLTDEGMAELMGQLWSGCYDVAVPEEGAMMVVAWIAEHGHAQAARELIEELGPFFPRLRATLASGRPGPRIDPGAVILPFRLQSITPLSARLRRV